MCSRRMKKKVYIQSVCLKLLLIGCAVFVINSGCSVTTVQENYGGTVPNEETAIKIAEAIWLAKHGKRIYEELPFVATLRSDSIWVVEGTFKKKKGRKGGLAHIEIQKKDCKILANYHGK
jgi:hypothetical protein